jgi:hypothetical protein
MPTTGDPNRRRACQVIADLARLNRQPAVNQYPETLLYLSKIPGLLQRSDLLEHVSKRNVSTALKQLNQFNHNTLHSIRLLLHRCIKV